MAKIVWSRLSRALTYLAAISVPTIVAFWLGVWLQGDLTLECRIENDVIASVGSSKLAPALALEVSRVSYRGEDYEALRVLYFSIVNTDWQSLPSGARFFFVPNTPSALPEKAVVHMYVQSKISASEVVLTTRDNVPGTGPGFVPSV